MTRPIRDCRRSTPWGYSDSATDYARGVTFYSTPSHGGLHVAPTLNATIPDHLREASGWYEEDCDWCRVVLAFPDLFTAEERVDAESTLRHWHPARWERHTGRTLAPGESHVRDRDLFMAAHVNDWLAIAAVGDWATGVPAGYVRVTATRGGRRGGAAERDFLVTAAEYDERGGFAFVVDVTRHAEAA